jgi:hypothetical protein
MWVEIRKLVSVGKIAAVCCAFFFFGGQKDSVQRIFIKKYFLFTVGSVCRVKRFTNGSRNSLKGVRKLQMMPDHIALVKLRQKQLCSVWMLIVFWDSQGTLLAHFQKRGENVNFASYSEVLLKLPDTIGRKRPGQPARRVLFHHDNARPHTARATLGRIQELQWELLEHPPYSRELGP